jgi:hypothetical protein
MGEYVLTAKYPTIVVPRIAINRYQRFISAQDPPKFSHVLAMMHLLWSQAIHLDNTADVR